jgi:hypothetical protein
MLRPLSLAFRFALALFASAGPALAAAAEPDPKPGYAIGRVTMEDGSPLSGDIQDVTVTLDGVSEAGEKVHYSPAVKNGAYRQKLVKGQYTFGRSTVQVKFGEHTYLYKLVPKGKLWNKSQDAEEGLVQDFVWKPTGLAETYGAKPDPNNATHWHGMNIGLRFQTYREDIKTTPPMLPEGTKLILTLVPTSPSIDGRTLKPITVERDWRPKATTYNDDLNDLPPANYELTGVARLPNGSSKPLLLQGMGHYPKYYPKVAITVGYDAILGGMWKAPVGWVTD